MMNGWPSPALSETSSRTESTGQGPREELCGRMKLLELLRAVQRIKDA